MKKAAMDIRQRIRETKSLTATDEQIVRCALEMGEGITRCSISEFARASSASIASIHRFCKKIGLPGFKAFKIELARAYERRRLRGDVDFNVPFGPDDSSQQIAMKLTQLYAMTLTDTDGLMDYGQVDKAARLLNSAETVDIYAQSHNLFPAQMFSDRLLSIGKRVTCVEGQERRARIALNSNSKHTALVISYLGSHGYLRTVVSLLLQSNTPVVLVGTPHAATMNPGLDAYVLLSDREEPFGRIGQFSSHLAVQYALDLLFGCMFARRYEDSLAFLRRFTPYTGEIGE